MPTPQSLCQIQIYKNESTANPEWVGYGAGVLIHPQWVLTAAHVSHAATDDAWLRVVLSDPPGPATYSHPTSQRFVRVKSRYVDPEFNPATNTPVHSDIALLQLAEPVTDFAVQPFLVDWDWYQSRWQHRQLPLQFWGRPFQEGFADVVENDQRIHLVRREESDGVLGIQMDVDEDSELKVKGGIPDGFSGGPVLATLRSGEQVCVGLTVQGGALFGRAASTSFALSTRLILPWLDKFAQSDNYRQSYGKDRLYQTVDAKGAEAFSIFNWRPAEDYQTLYDEDDIGALLTWNTALSPLIGRTREQKEFNHWLARIKTRHHPGLHVRVVHGEGGVGKTRFVCEWAEECSKQGWQVADASRTAWQDIKDALETDSSLPWLIVLDYPELNQNLLEAVDVLGKAVRETMQNIVLVLLSRHDENRWQPFFKVKKFKCLVIDYYPLQPIAPQPSYQLLRELLEKLNAQSVQIEPEDYLHWLRYDAATTPDGRRYMEYPLMILGQAVCLAKDPTLDFKKLSHDKVLDALVKIVQRKLNLAEKQQGIKQDSVQWGVSLRLNMLAILFGGIKLRTLEILSQHKNCTRLGLPREQSEVPVKLVGLNVLRQKILHPMTPDVFATAFAINTYESMNTMIQHELELWIVELLNQQEPALSTGIFSQRYIDSVFAIKRPMNALYKIFIRVFDGRPKLIDKALNYVDGGFVSLPKLAADILYFKLDKLSGQPINYLDEKRRISSNLSSLLFDSGDRQGALNMVEIEIKIARELVKKNFFDHSTGLSLGLVKIFGLLMVNGEPTKAMIAIREAEIINKIRNIKDWEHYPFFCRFKWCKPMINYLLSLCSSTLLEKYVMEDVKRPNKKNRFKLDLIELAEKELRPIAELSLKAYTFSLSDIMYWLRMPSPGFTPELCLVSLYKGIASIYRNLADDWNLDVLRLHYVSILNTFFIKLIEVGDFNYAQSVIQEALENYCKLSKSILDSYNRVISSKLSNLSLMPQTDEKKANPAVLIPKISSNYQDFEEASLGDPTAEYRIKPVCFNKDYLFSSDNNMIDTLTINNYAIASSNYDTCGADLAAGFCNLASHIFNKGDTALALKLMRESVLICRKVYASRPSIADIYGNILDSYLFMCDDKIKALRDLENAS